MTISLTAMLAPACAGNIAQESSNCTFQAPGTSWCWGFRLLKYTARITAMLAAARKGET
jgi:hypothetical protein